MPRGHPRDPRKEQFWRDHLARWQCSRLSIRAYCAQHRLATPSFYAWRRTLALRDRQPQTAAPLTFVPLQLVPETTAPPPRLEVLLSNGRRLRLDPSVPARVVRDLVAVLEELPC
jgi:hypothetical protein